MDYPLETVAHPLDITVLPLENQVNVRDHKGQSASTAPKTHGTVCVMGFDQNRICAANAMTGNVIIVRSKKMMNKSLKETGIFDPSRSPPTSDI